MTAVVEAELRLGSSEIERFSTISAVFEVQKC